MRGRGDLSGQLNDRKPIFEQIKDWISDQIISGTLREDDRVPSTNEIVQFYKDNHVTVAKGVNQLVEQGVIDKKRGVGMFVAPDAKEKLISERKQNFKEEYLKPMMDEARKLRLTDQEISQLITEMKGSDTDEDRKSTRLNSSHVSISYAVFCLKKKKEI